MNKIYKICIFVKVKMSVCGKFVRVNLTGSGLACWGYCEGGRRETGEGRQEKGDRRRETGGRGWRW